MPMVKINMIEGRTKDEKYKIAEVVHEALVKSFKIPDDDNNIRFDEYKEENYILPPGKSKQYVYIEIAVFEGRTLEAKRLLFRLIVDNLSALGIKPDDVLILLEEDPMQNWGMRGGIPACDIDLGFEVKV